MSKRTVPLIVILAILFCLTAGCASEAQQASASQPAEAAAAATDIASEEQGGASAAAISYPLEGDDLSFTYWYSSPSYTKWVADNSSFFCIPYAEEATGVTLDFIECSEQAVTEQFNLMIASGDWADLIPVNERYTGGLSQAYSDGVVTDLTDLIKQYMPDYTKVLEAQDEQVQSGVLTDGKMLAFAQISDGVLNSAGLVTRGDWLKKAGYEFSGKTVTLSEFTDLMRMMVTDFGCDSAYFVRQDGAVTGVSAAFDTTVPSLSGNSSSVSAYRMGDTIVSGWTSDGTRKYIEWFSGLVKEGVLDGEFISVTADQGVLNTACGTGLVGVWQANADKLDEIKTYADSANAGLECQAIPPVVSDDNTTGETMWNTEPNLVSLKMSISSTSEKAELICKWMNYFWTEEGNLLANYGVKGQSFDIDENGDVKWLDLVTNEPKGANSEMASTLYSYSRFCTFYNDYDKLLSTYTDNAIAAVELWTQPGTYERQYPSFAGLTTEETSQTSTKIADMCTYAQQTVLRWMTGQDELTDAAWSEYVKNMDELGMKEVLEVYQNAYNEYAAGTRHIASATAAVGGPAM